MSLRVALLGIYHESNTFTTELTTIKNFQDSHLLYGSNIIKEYTNAHHEIGGMIEILDDEKIEIIPILFAEATPGGIIQKETFDYLLQEMLRRLENILPIDGCLVIPHGAGVSEKHRDMDGYWLQSVRNILGPKVPIIGTLDLHANVSQQMIDNTDALISYKKNPHLDQRERGKEAASILIKTMRGEIVPKQELIQLPLIIGIEQQYTEEFPCQEICRFIKNLENKDNIISISVNLGFPYADVTEMGTSIIIVRNNLKSSNNEISLLVKKFIINLKEHFVGKKISLEEVIIQLPKLEKPILLLDMGDNIGGGTSGKGLSLINALEKLGNYRYFSYQPGLDLIRQLANCNVNETYEVIFRHEFDQIKHNCTIPLTLLARFNGEFSENNPQHGGQKNYNMGETCICSTPNGSIIMLSSLRIPPFSLQQMLAFGLDPEKFDVIIAKGVNAPIAAYGPKCKTIIKVNTIGESTAEITQLNYNYRRKPLYPFE